MPDLSEPLPAGEYTAIVVESERKATKAGTGEYIKLVWEVQSGLCRGRKLFDYINLYNQDPVVVEKAKGRLAAVCMAVGVPRPVDSAQLHRIPATLRVGVRKNKESGQFENFINAYHPLSGGLPPAAAPAEPVKPLAKDESDPF